MLKSVVPITADNTASKVDFSYAFATPHRITAGDGGAVATNDQDLYARAFAFHDQGHSPLRQGVEVGKRPFIGLDFRMTELTAAVLIAQLKRTKHEEKGERMPYWGDSLVANSINYRKDTPLQNTIGAITGAQCIIFGMFGVKIKFNGDIRRIINDLKKKNSGCLER